MIKFKYRLNFLMNMKRWKRIVLTASALGIATPISSYITVYNIENLLAEKKYMYNIESLGTIISENGNLYSKAKRFQSEVDAKHVTLDGLIQGNGSFIESRDDYPLGPMGDSMLESSLYLMSQVYRYNVTFEPEAKENIEKIIRGLHKLFEVSDKKGYPARFLTKTNSELNHSATRKGNGKYSDYLWVGDTSRDQYIGLIAAYTLCYDLLDDEKIKKIVAKDIFDLSHHLLDNEWKLIDPESGQTRHGRMHHFFPINTLNVLKSASHLTNDERFIEEYNKWSNIYSKINWPCVFDFKINLIYHNRNHNDNISMLCYYNLLRLEKEDRLIDYYRENMNRMWRRSLKGEGNSFFNFIYMSKCADDNFDESAIKEAIKSLEDFPLEKDDFKPADPERNELRKRTAFNLSTRRFERVLADPLPINQRAFRTSFVWQRCPYESGFSNVDNTNYARIDYLLAYWMGRHYEFINEKN